MVIFDQKIIGYINVFEKYTHTNVKDCFSDDGSLIFVVETGEVGKAIGKKGINIKKLGFKFKKRIRVIEYHPDPIVFVRSLLMVEPEEIVEEDDRIIIRSKNTKEKGLIFGREKSNLKKMQEIVKRYFDVELVVE